MEHGHNTRDDLEGAHDFHAPPGVGKYVTVFLALCVLTAISFAVGNSQQLRENSPGVMWAMMMAVSCAKAMLVILFFMHLRWEANWKYVLTVPASIMSLFLVIMLIPDIGRRTLYYSPVRWLYAPAPGSEHGEEAGHLPGASAAQSDDHTENSPAKGGH
jgi:cytochrome c oxidase subunit 4